MPFGSIFGAIVFGVLGPALGLRMIADRSVPLRVMGASLALLGVAIALGLLMKRPWARWLGVLSAVLLAAFAALSTLSVFHLTVLLAAVAVAILLAIPGTGRPIVAADAAPRGPSVVSRALCATACLAITGVLGAVPATLGKRAPQREAATDPAAAPGPASASAEPVRWHDFADGLKAAKSGRKLIVADFYATWCGPCKILEKRTFKDPRVLDRLRDVVPVRVDAEETVERGGLKGIDLALRYAVEVYPTIVVVDGDGHEIARNTGVMSADEFLAWIDAVIERAGTTIARS
ncbi:MAG TPA: thioredoxin fold domain-containing protein [Candidatus Polarisedimenticolaceae bacterium]|nr:thioredoxin fold domain-containing protein [Candidatus Polarisedimenticolaceae bacterium]